MPDERVGNGVGVTVIDGVGLPIIFPLHPERTNTKIIVKIDKLIARTFFMA